jgi:hypothetical protein
MKPIWRHHVDLRYLRHVMQGTAACLQYASTKTRRPEQAELLLRIAGCFQTAVNHLDSRHPDFKQLPNQPPTHDTQ